MDQNSILKAQETRKRLEKCWSEDIDWNLYPESLKKVNTAACIIYIYVQGLMPNVKISTVFVYC